MQENYLRLLKVTSPGKVEQLGGHFFLSRTALGKSKKSAISIQVVLMAGRVCGWKNLQLAGLAPVCD